MTPEAAVVADQLQEYGVPAERAAFLAQNLLSGGLSLERALAIAEQRAEAWRQDRAREYLLDDGQLAWTLALDAMPPASWSAWKIARQRGKTFAALVWTFRRMALEPGLSAIYLAQTGANALSIVTSFLREIQDDLPPEWEVRIADGIVRFSNGSELATFGTDNNQYRRSRGRKAKIVLLDEAAFYADLADVEQVYIPQLQTTGGVGLYLSSPPISPAHEFNARCRSAMAAGRYVHDTFWGNPRIQHEEIIRGEMDRLGLTREGLLASTAFRREFLAEDVTEETRAAMPSWNQDMHSRVVRVRARPRYFDAYVSIDTGKIGDPHAALFAWHDPETSTVHFEAELELRSASTTVAGLAEAIKGTEKRLYGADKWEGKLLGAPEWRKEFGDLPPYLKADIQQNAPQQPWLRVGDDDHFVLNSLCNDHGLAIIATQKDNKHQAIDKVNELFRAGKVSIDPSCVRLIEQLYSTVWNRARTHWEHTNKDHGDLLDCASYLLRNVNWHRDARPPAPVDALRHIPQGPDPLDALRGVFRR